MTLTDRYLKAVAAQLPKAQREDIVAELRDAIETRMEARQNELGRRLTEADEEAVLREFGHPLNVAGRYGSGPQSIVGPELYPWWMFGIRIALAVLICIVATGFVIRVVIGDADVGQAMGQAFASLFSGGVTIVGFATIAAFIIERQSDKPEFLTQWRVRDLALFELGGFDPETVSRTLSGGEASEPRRAKPSRLSPTAAALASAAGWAVILLWWIGVLNVSALRPEDFGAVVDGVDYVAVIRQIAALLFWPVTIYAGTRILFDLNRAARPEAVRLTALGDLGFGAAQAALFIWLWQGSPLAPLIRVEDAGIFVKRVQVAVETGDWILPTVLMMGVAFGLVQALFKMSGALWRLVSGRVPGRPESAADEGTARLSA